MTKNSVHTFVVLAYKESDYLEECIKSVLNQKYKSHVLIATSTPNDYINNLANKYNLKVIINPQSKGIGYDFDFATNCYMSTLITVAHQDDIYDYDFSYRVIEEYNKRKNATIIFTDYYEIRNHKSDNKNRNLKIKRFLLFPLKLKWLGNFKVFKRHVLRFGNAICCPAVTFVQNNVPRDKFESIYKCNIDWEAWEKLSKLKGPFIYIDKMLMGHRIHNDSTTTKIIENNIRTKEDLIMFKKFWPSFIAKILAKLYKKSEKSNKI